jgi:arylsulfatase A-like enzyme
MPASTNTHLTTPRGPAAFRAGDVERRFMRSNLLAPGAPTKGTAPVLLSFLMVAAVMLMAVPVSATTAPAPNIILILADDLGYGDLGCYGQRTIQTPHLDRMAREGLRFTQFYTGAPVCAPARETLLTGRHTGHAQLRANAKLDLRPTDTTIAALLRPRGYVTALIGKWGLGREGGPAAPRGKGFDYFFGYVDQTMAHNYYPTFLIRNEEHVPLRNVVPNPGPYHQGVASEKVDYSADLIAADVVQFIRAHRDRRFFLFFAPTLPHANGEAAPNGLEVPDYGPYTDQPWSNAAKGYAAMVTRLDAEVGRLLETLQALSLDENTLVIFTSDNGPHAEGGYDPATFDSAGGLRGKKRDLYEGGIREPLIVRWPGHVPAGKTTDGLAYFPDMMATLADLTGAKAPPHDGLSLLPTFRQTGAQPKHDYLYWEFYEEATAQAVRFDRWKAIRSPALTGKMELYDLESDPAESHNVAPEHPELVERAGAMMQQAHEPSPIWNGPGRTQIGRGANGPKP